MKDPLSTTLTAVETAIITSLLGGWDVALEIMLIVVVMDYVTGVTAAFITKTLKSSTGYEGIVKKGTMFLIVILAAQVDKLTNNTGNIFRTCTAFFFIANESLSIIENAQKIGIEFPTFLEKFLRRLKNANSDPESLQNYLPQNEFCPEEAADHASPNSTKNQHESPQSNG